MKFDTDAHQPPLLSLCIPTYNRAALLSDALDTILAQWESDLTETQRAQVEIVVSDNNSPDKTPEVIARIRSKQPRLCLTYLRQLQNLGAGANVVTVIQKATGDYVYVLSDDDLLLPGALSKIFQLAQQHPNLDAFCLNPCGFIHHPEETRAPILSVSEDTIIQNQNQALLFLGTWITFLSILVFRREAIAGQDYTTRKDTGIPQSYPFLDALARNNGVLVTKEVFLAVRGNNTGGYNFFTIFVTNFQYLLLYASEIGYSPEAARQVFRQHLRKFLFPFLLSFKRKSFGTLTMNYWEGARCLLRAYGPDPFLLFVMLPLLFAPPALLQAAFALRRSLRSVKP